MVRYANSLHNFYVFQFLSQSQPPIYIQSSRQDFAEGPDITKFNNLRVTNEVGIWLLLFIESVFRSGIIYKQELLGY